MLKRKKQQRSLLGKRNQFSPHKLKAANWLLQKIIYLAISISAISICFFIGALLFPIKVFAAPRYFVTNALCNNTWSDLDCWSTTSGGSGGSALPLSTDDVYFDGNSCTGTCTTVTQSANPARSLNIDFTNFTKTISFTYPLNVYGNMTLVSGMTFNPGTQIISFLGSSAQSLTSAGKTFYSITINNTGGIILNDDLNVSAALLNTAGGITAGTYKVSLIGNTSASLTAGTGGLTLYQLDINKGNAAVIRQYNTLTVTNTLTLTEGMLRAGSGSIDAQGDIIVTNGFGDYSDSTYSNGVIRATGSGNQTLYGNGGYLPVFTINKSGGTLYFSGTVKVINNFTHTAGTVDAATNSTLLLLGTTGNSSLTAVTLNFGTITLYDVEINYANNCVVSVQGAGTVTNDLTLTEGTWNYSSGSLHLSVQGDLIIGANFGDFNDSYMDGDIQFSGSNSQTITSSGGYLPDIYINKSAGSTLTLMSNISFAGSNFSYTAGDFIPQSYKVSIVSVAATYVAPTLTGNGITFYDLEVNLNNTVDLNIVGTSNVSHDLTLIEGSIDAGTNGVISVSGNVNVSSGFADSNDSNNDGYIGFAGSGNQELTIASGGYLPSVRIDKSGGNLTLNNDMIILGSFDYNNGTIVWGSYSLHLFKAAATYSNTNFYGGNLILPRLIIQSNDTNYVTMNEIAEVSGTLTLIDGGLNNGTSGDLQVSGNLVIYNTFGYSTVNNDGIISLTGNNDLQTISSSGGDSGILPFLRINKASASNVATFLNDINITGSLLYLQGAPNFGTTKVTMTTHGAGLDLSGGTGFNLYDLELNATASTIDVDLLGITNVLHDLTLTLGRLDAGTSGDLRLYGNLYVGALYGASATTHDGLISLLGSNSQTINYTTGGILPTMVINKTNASDVVTVQGTGPVNHYENLTITQGIYDINGLDLSLQATSTFSNTNNGSLRLNGSETVTFAETSGFDENSGTIIFKGDTTYSSGLPNGFGDYFWNLIFNNSSGEWALDADLRVDATLTIQSGILSQGNYQIRTVGANIGSSGIWKNIGSGDLLLGTGNLVNSGELTFKSNNSCGSTDEIVITAISGTPSWSGSGSYNLQDVSLTSQNAAVAITVFSGTNVSGNTGSWTFNSTCPTTLSCDIVDGLGAPVSSPTVPFTNIPFSVTYRTSTALLGVSSQKIRITNSTSNPQWSVSLAATAGPTAYWDGVSADYDFNDPTSAAGDGSDADSLGGQLSIDPTNLTITPQSGCNSNGLTAGSIASYNEENSTNSITLISSNSSAGTGCYWDITDIGMSQSVPAQQSIDSYNLNMTLTIVAL